MAEVEKLIEIYQQLEDAGLMVVAGKKDTAELMVSHDVVPVVRCKDCEHWHEETGWCYHHSHFIGSKGEACHPWESCDWKMLDADDFCSYGERKDNG